MVATLCGLLRVLRLILILSEISLRRYLPLPSSATFRNSSCMIIRSHSPTFCLFLWQFNLYIIYEDYCPLTEIPMKFVTAPSANDQWQESKFWLFRRALGLTFYLLFRSIDSISIISNIKNLNMPHPVQVQYLIQHTTIEYIISLYIFVMHTYIHLWLRMEYLIECRK